MYITLTNENFDREVLEASVPVVVFFEAPWSGACQIVAPIISTIASEFSNGVKVGRLDTDVHSETAMSYGIFRLPTMLFFQRGEVVDHLTGVISREDLTIRLDALLKDH